MSATVTNANEEQLMFNQRAARSPINLNNDDTVLQPICKGAFTIMPQTLNNIAYACQDREFSEEIDMLEQNGGETWLEVRSVK